MSESLLKARGLRREFPTPASPLVILEGIDLELARGASLAIMGPSGSGKSTLLQILGTLDRPTSGELAIDGVNPFALDARELARFRNTRIGFIFQDHHLLPQCTVLENVLLPALAGFVEPGGVEARARELIETVGLKGRIDHRPGELSGGERQRVAVARALINSPALLLCDEPTGNLDAKTADAIGELFATLRKETEATIVAVTHSESFAARFESRRVLESGRLRER